MKKYLNGFLSSSDLEKIEQHLIYCYIVNKQIDFEKSPILSQYFHNFKPHKEILFSVSSFKLSTIKELENRLELLIPPKDKKLNGAFFTPAYIVDFIINEVQPKKNDKNLDPSCGCGAFLIGLTEYYKKNFSKPIKAIVKENIFGSDILLYNIKRTKLLLALYALQCNEVLEDTDFNLYHQDSLRANWHTRFDTIVGNPPYVKFQDLSLKSRKYLEQNWSTLEGGSFNLYFAFFELGYELLNPSGRLGYITPNNYFTSLAGEAMRQFFQEKKCVRRIIDFTHKKIFDAQTYTALTFLTKQPNEAIVFDRIKENYTPQEFLATANGSPNYLKDLNVKKWRLLKTEEQLNIKNIETIGTPLSTLFDISVGIATLKDQVFFIDGNIQSKKFYQKHTDKGIFNIEKSITRPIYKISDFKTQSDVERNTRRIIFPYIIKNNIAVPIPEADLRKKFPQCYEYLVSEKEALLKRDKGKIQYDPFYVWGRTQGLMKVGKKIISPTFSQSPRFLIVKDEDAYFTNGYGTYFKNTSANNSSLISSIDNIDVVQKILNSFIMQYYVSRTSVAIEGGYMCYQKNFIEKFTIPEFSEKEIQVLRSLENPNDIDKYLIDKYQLKILSPNLCS